MTLLLPSMASGGPVESRCTRHERQRGPQRECKLPKVRPVLVSRDSPRIDDRCASGHVCRPASSGLVGLCSQPSHSRILLFWHVIIAVSNVSPCAVERPSPPPPQVAGGGYPAGRRADGQHGKGGRRPQHVATEHFKGDRRPGTYAR